MDLRPASPALPARVLPFPAYSRRLALQSLSSGFGYLAFAGLAQAAAGSHAAAESDSRSRGIEARDTHFAPRARRVIFLCMNGGPSHVDLLDEKPLLNRYASEGKAVDGRQIGARALGSVFPFSQHGQSGLRMSAALPHLAAHADDLCIINSMQTDLPNHAQAFVQMHTGNFQFVRPSLGAWTLYGLGTENSRLPGFVTLNPPTDNGGSRNYGSGFLPAIFQGTRIGTGQIPGFYAALLGVHEEPGPPLRNVDNEFLDRMEQRKMLDLVRDLNTRKLSRDQHHPEIEGAIESFELAFRMQDSLPELLELKSETPETLAMYGIGGGQPTDPFGRQCLLARRLAEAGVRFIEITAPVGWDHHFQLKEELTKSCLATDQPMAALLTDLKQRGLLDDTLVIWSGEFGRTPYAQSGNGRDHNNKGFSLWMAGGGVRRGLLYGATDDFGTQAVENPVHVHDWHATILHLLGLDHERLTFRYAGRSFRLTDVYGNVVGDILS